jgi:MarR family transcriptional regulator, organic hydroperoxide resistance regulator
MLKRLEQQGLLTRRRGEHDERTRQVALTEAGRTLRERAEAVPTAVLDRLGVPVARLEALRDELTALLAASRAAQG